MYYYKYMSREVGRTVLKNRTLRWSTPATFNDIFDLQFDLRFDVDREAAKRIALAKLWDAHYGENPPEPKNKFGHVIAALRGRFPRLDRNEFDREFGEALDQGVEAMLKSLPEFYTDVRAHLARSKILCLSERADSNLMWAHYGEQHRGIVLGFRNVDGLDSPYVTAKPVNYVGEMPPLYSTETFAEFQSGNYQLSVSDTIHAMVYTKSGDWAYERELRLYSGDGRNAEAPFEDINFHEKELGVIIFGVRMADAERKEFSELAKSKFPSVELFQANQAGRSFNIEIVPYR
jgi:hypothetical protein